MAHMVGYTTKCINHKITLKPQSLASVLNKTRARACTIRPPAHCGRYTHTYRQRAFTPINAAASSPSSSSDLPPSQPPVAFAGLERLINNNFGQDSTGGERQGDWKQVEDCWVLYPPQGKPQPRCLIHFIGGAFVGAASQLAYAPLLEALSERGALIITSPYATTFNYYTAVDDIHSKTQRCMKALGPQATTLLPSFGVGHSLGSLMHLLICSRYIVPRAGNCLLSFNNRPATDAIPVLSPVIAPYTRALRPILNQLATSPLRSGVEQWIDTFRSLAPSTVQQALPILEQLAPIFLDVAEGVEEFSPSPEQTRTAIKNGYSVPKNLLIRFKDDEIDETPQLASVLQSSAAASANLELTVKTMEGDHIRPLQQDLSGRLPPDLARVASAAASQGESFWGQVGVMANQATGLPAEAKEGLSAFAKVAGGLTAAVGKAVSEEGGGGGRGSAQDDIDELADEIAAWTGVMEVKKRPVGPAALPAPSSS